MPNKDYEKTISWLFEQFPSYQKIGSKAYKPTLENIEKILNAIGNPQHGLKFVHVAGSNGKGSVCSIISSSLSEAGHKVGLFTSPHIKDFTERIRVNGNPIDKEEVIAFVKTIQEKQLDFSPSFFEITFAMALQHFLNENCDVCVIETGLGGRLDATNIITPIVSVITSISLEHTEILGDTIDAIAREKAGIIKPEIPVVIGKLLEEAKTVIEEVADYKNSEVIEAYSKSLPSVLTDFLLAEYQLENLFIAEKTLEYLNSIGLKNVEKDLENGLRNIGYNTGYKGRLQIVGEDPLIILDASHNPAGIHTTIEALQKVNEGQLHIIIGMSNDKDIESIIKVLPEKAIYYVTEFANQRSAKQAKLAELFGQSSLESIDYFNEPEIAFEMAKNIASEKDTILVIGSFFLLEHFF